jgi:Phosphopantetheine attachment site
VRVLELAVRASAPDGFVFIGDVRTLPLLEAFHADVELCRAPGPMTLAELRQRVSRQIAQEKELLLQPEFFGALSAQLPAVDHVTLRLKRGVHANEFTRFRYDAVLELAPADAAIAVEPLDWERDGLSVDVLRGLLARTEPSRLWITGVPNARVATQLAASELIHDDGLTTVADLRGAVEEARGAAVDPEALWGLGEVLSYEVDLRVRAGEPADRFDVVLERRGGGGAAPHLPVRAPLPESRQRPRPWTAYANNPLQGLFAQKLVPELRRFLEERLPAYMVPSAFLPALALPKTASGKIDRLALPPPDTTRRELARTYVAPRGAAELVMAGIWEDVLGIEGIGAHDDFFAELGGHSLLGTQVISRARETFQLEVPLGRLFEAPTVAGLVEAMKADPVSGASVERIGELLLEVAEMSEEDVESMLSSRPGG